MMLPSSNPSNQYARGNDQYPTDLTAAYSLLVHFKPATTESRRPPPRVEGEQLQGMTFVQGGAAIVAGTDGAVHNRVTCYR